MAFMKTVKKFFTSHPLIANSVTFGTMWGFSDFSQQIITKKFVETKKPSEPINKGTIVRCAVVGSCVTSNILFFWLELVIFISIFTLLTYILRYKWLEKRFVGNSGKILVTKIILDQFVLTPPLLSAFFISMSILESKENIFGEWREKIIPTMKKAWFFWLPAQIVNFLLIPPAVRITYISCCSFVWTNILCFVKRSNNNNTEYVKAK